MKEKEVPLVKTLLDVFFCVFIIGLVCSLAAALYYLFFFGSDFEGIPILGIPVLPVPVMILGIIYLLALPVVALIFLLEQLWHRRWLWPVAFVAGVVVIILSLASQDSREGTLILYGFFGLWEICYYVLVLREELLIHPPSRKIVYGLLIAFGLVFAGTMIHSSLIVTRGMNGDGGRFAPEVEKILREASSLSAVQER